MAEAITLEDVKAREDIQTYIRRADQNMEAIGYTEHGFRHATVVSEHARSIIASLGRSPREAELAAIAGFIHDIGNVAGAHGARANRGAAFLRHPA